jgi:hypothetical protein
MQREHSSISRAAWHVSQPYSAFALVDDDGEADPVVLQDIDASNLNNTTNRWADLLADVDDEEDEG